MDLKEARGRSSAQCQMNYVTLENAADHSKDNALNQLLLCMFLYERIPQYYTTPLLIYLHLHLPWNLINSNDILKHAGFVQPRVKINFGAVE
jgi:hypothetical protein